MTLNSTSDTPTSEPSHESAGTKPEQQPNTLSPETTSFEVQMVEAKLIMDEDREVLSELAK